MKVITQVLTGDNRVAGFVTSTKTPNYWNLVRLKQRLPINDHELKLALYNTTSVVTYNGVRNQFQSRAPKLPGVCWTAGSFSSTGAGIPSVSTGVPTRDELVALLSNRILAKVRETPVDLGVALGEYRETANFVASAMVKTVQAAKAARKGNLSEMVKIISGRHKGSNIARIAKLPQNKRSPSGKWLKPHERPLQKRELKMLDVMKRDTSKWSAVPLSAAGTNLALNYAVAPLVRDVAGVMDIYQNGLFRSETAPLVFKTAYLPHFTKGSSQNANKQAGFTYSMSVKGRAEIRAWIDNPLTATLDKLGLLNPISTGYELVPFSFVLDWFVPIGDWLQNVPDPKGLSIIDGYISTKMEANWTEWTKIPSPAPGWNTAMYGKQVWKTRNRILSWPKYTLKPANVGTYRRRVANGTSLIANFLFSEETPKSLKPTKGDYKKLAPLGISRSLHRLLARKYR